MKKNGAKTSILLPMGDLILVVCIFVLGYWLRHFALAGLLEKHLGLINDFRMELWYYLVSGAVMGCMVVFMLRTFRVYRKEFGIASVEELSWILRVSFTAVVITFAFTFASRQLMFSRFVLLFAFPATSLSIYLWHGIYHRMNRKMALNRGNGVKIAFYGCNEYARELEEYMTTKVTVPYISEGFVAPLDRKEHPPEDVYVFENCDQLFDWIRKTGVDEIIIANPDQSREDKARLLYNCEQENISYKLLADISELVTRTTRVLQMGGITMIESVPPPLSGSSLLLKRLFDIVVAVAATVLLLPVGLVIAAAIVIDSGFPVFYVQKRLGRNHRSFRLIKFRSMKKGAHGEKEEVVPSKEYELLSKRREDPRITGVGKLIRRFSLDELPQLLNVISGSMSLVGPRPHVPEEVSRYSIRHFKKLEVPPGMTGICQVSGRNDLSYREMVKLDIYYVDNWSTWLDLSILIKTLPAMLSRKGAY